MLTFIIVPNVNASNVSVTDPPNFCLDSNVYSSSLFFAGCADGIQIESDELVRIPKFRFVKFIYFI
jgi:hypothetical protein